MKIQTIILIAFVSLLIGLTAEVLGATPFPTPEQQQIQRTHYEYSHVVSADAYEHEDICLSVFIDQIMEGDEARVQFKTPSEGGFRMMTLGYNPSEQRFMVCISERYHMNSAIEYYIELFPVGMAPIRIPEKPGEFNRVKVRKKYSKLWEPILIGLLIASPALGAFLYSKIRKAHAKRKAEYENKLRARRKKLHKEREKHYQEYLKTLSGRKVVKSQPTTPKTAPTPSESPRKTASPQPEKHEMDDTDKELRQELDNILNVIPTGDRSETAADRRFSHDKRQHQNSPPKPSTGSDTKGSDGLNDDERKKLKDLFKE